LAEVTIEDFANFQEIWGRALPEEKAGHLSSMAERLYVDFVRVNF
jgi:hypothetical protein